MRNIDPSGGARTAYAYGICGAPPEGSIRYVAACCRCARSASACSLRAIKGQQFLMLFKGQRFGLALGRQFIFWVRTNTENSGPHPAEKLVRLWITLLPMSVDEYRKWRQVAISLHDKIRDVYVSGPVVDKAAKQLGVLVDKKTLIFDTDRQIDAFMECCLYLVKHKGMTPIERYANEVTPENSLEQALLQSFQQSKAGFYVIDSIDRHMCGLTLSGLFGAPGVTITDINFSKSVPPGFILHTRPLVLPGLAMASGCTFVFTPDKASLIQRLWNSNWKNLSPLYQFTNIFNFNNGSGVPVVTA